MGQDINFVLDPPPDKNKHFAQQIHKLTPIIHRQTEF